MKNFIFKSYRETDLYKIFTQLDLLLREQRMQRSDLQEVKRLLKADTDEGNDHTAEEQGYDPSKDSE